MFIFCFGVFVLLPAFLDWCLIADMPNAWVMWATLGFWIVVIIIKGICDAQEATEADKARHERLAAQAAARKKMEEQKETKFVKKFVKNKSFDIKEDENEV